MTLKICRKFYHSIIIIWWIYEIYNCHFNGIIHRKYIYIVFGAILTLISSTNIW